MNKKTRYLLILIGFIIFLILAPLIVLYVRGITFDFKTRQFTHTGILATRTEPKSVKIKIDGKEVLDSSGDVKFLLPGEYSVTVQKDGYFDWSKRLSVLEGQVTWASPAPNKLFLFLKNSTSSVLSSDVMDFFADNNSVVYLNGKSISVSAANNPANSQNYSLSKRVIQMSVSPNGQIFVLTDPSSSVSPQVILIFDKNSRAITDLTGLLSTPAIFKFSGNNQLYALSDQNLYRLDLQQKTKTLVKSQVLAFNFRENDLYYLQANASTTDLAVSSPAEASGTIILSGIPAFSQGEIYVDFEKQILLLLDGQLYSVGSTLENLSGSVNAWNFDYNQSTLIFSHDGELSYYNPFQHNVDFITRSSSGITNPILNLSFSNAFFIRDNKLEALELDTRDHQNDYVLYKGDNLQKFILDSNAINAYVLDNGVLKILKIR